MASAEKTVRSPLGELPLDSEGSPIGAVRLDPARSYQGIPALLKRVIEEESSEAWSEIRARIDYTYECIAHALRALEGETAFGRSVHAELERGRKLLFKPNTIQATAIDPQAHGEGVGWLACTPWPFVAGVLRWFHDELGVSYHQMAVGEASTTLTADAGRLTLHYGRGRTITPEAVLEGRSGDFYGGWGFYFARRYLAEAHDPSHRDDPMRGFEDSASGTYVTPGRADDRLPVYDLNHVQAAPFRGRDVPVPEGANFQQITLHKAVVGGDPGDQQDLKDYPGCVLVNLPKLKVHNMALLTCAVKNLGIGLYPMQAAADGDPSSTSWKYGSPDGPVPGIKSRIPHQVWMPEAVDEMGLAARDESGRYRVRRTAGLPGTMVDVNQAVAGQGVFMLSVVDAIETANVSHMGSPPGVAVPEGYVLAGLDPVALDLLCGRYMFATVPMAEARRLRQELDLPSDFLRTVPLPTSDGRNIVSGFGLDSPLSRDRLPAYAEGRGLGRQQYHVVGRDLREGGSLASLQGRLGRLDGDVFSELLTSMLYFDFSKVLWDLQATALAYAEANDSLTGSRYRQELLEAYDENGDGVIDYEETGRKGHLISLLGATGYQFAAGAAEPYGFLRGTFQARAFHLKMSEPSYNRGGHDVLKGSGDTAACLIALSMSQTPEEHSDPFYPGLTWGKGKWPSLPLARQSFLSSLLYGTASPDFLDLFSLYAQVFQYADKTSNGGGYTGSLGPDSHWTAVERYVQAVAEGSSPLPFTVYVPPGLGKCGSRELPNVEETDDPARILTASFRGGEEAW